MDRQNSNRAASTSQSAVSNRSQGDLTRLLVPGVPAICTSSVCALPEFVGRGVGLMSLLGMRQLR